MKALVFASGRGTRMNEYTSRIPKPLVEVYGKPLLFRVLDNLEIAGVKEVYITVGYRANIIRENLGGRYEDIKIHYLDNPDWERGNIESLKIAEDVFDEPFLLCMGDHLAEPQLIKKLLTNKKNAAVTVALDKKYQQIKDDMKVLTKKEKVKSFGKNVLGQYVDTGFFIAKPEIFEYINKGDTELKDCMDRLAGKDKVKYVDVTGYFWVDIDTYDDLYNFYVSSFEEEFY